MTDAGRFERGEQYSAAHGVVTHRGVDPITGLDVLIYDFPGRPTMSEGPPVSDHLLKVLQADVREVDGRARGRLVVAYPSGATLLAPGESVVDDRFVLSALEGLRDAQARGLVHGDLTQSRILYSYGEVAIEGYGVPWHLAKGTTGDAKALAHADVVGLAKGLLALAASDLSVEVASALKAAASTATSPPMTSDRLYGIVKRLAGGAVKVPASGFTELTLPTVPVPRKSAPEPSEAPAQRPRSDPTTAPERPPAAAQGQAPRQQRKAEPKPTPLDPEPITLVSDPGLTPPRPVSPKDSSPGFVKALPPGAKYRHGNLEEGPRPAPIRMDGQESLGRVSRRAWRGPALLLLMLLVAGFAAYLTLLNQNSADDPVTSAFENYLVEVSVMPANLPPVQLVVDQSPAGSDSTPGTVMAAVPRSVTFDAAGRWVVHGRFQGRETPPVTLNVPQDTAITLTFPEPGQ